MRTILLEPLSLPWKLKPVSSAQSGSETLADGRRRFWIKEDFPGITPAMLVWWFSHLEGDMEIEGRRLPLYWLLRTSFRRFAASSSLLTTIVATCSDLPPV
jgi:hypothetical protein